MTKGRVLCMKYRFTAIADDGSTIRGTVDAHDKYEALARIREENALVTRLVLQRRISEILTM